MLTISPIRLVQIQCWTLTDYTKCVFLDADTLILQNSDELFEREEFSASPDAGWPDCFNSGVFVFRPNLNTFKVIYQIIFYQFKEPARNCTLCISGSREACDDEGII